MRLCMKPVPIILQEKVSSKRSDYVTTSSGASIMRRGLGLVVEGAVAIFLRVHINCCSNMASNALASFVRLVAGEK